MTRRLTNDEFLEKLSAVNDKVEPLEEYVTAQTKILVRCKKCGYTWHKRPSNLLKGQGCPKCGREKQIASMAETKRKTHDQFVAELSKVNDKVKVVGKYTYAKNRIEVECVECGHRWMAFPGNLLSGAGCRECSHKRHRISKQDFIDRLSEVNPDICLLSNYTMASEKAHFGCHVCGNDWYAVPTSILGGVGCPECGKSKLSLMHTKDPEVYARQFAKANKTIKLLSRYKGSDQHIDVECLVCGHKWSVTARNLLSNTGCPKCAGKMQLTNDEFVERVRMVNPNVIIKSKYVNSSTRVDAQCGVCGYEWSPTAGALMSGAGCSRCAGVLKRTNEQFLEELASVNDTITPLEEYKGANHQIKVQCNHCGHIWSADAYSLLHGGGCPQCATPRNSFFEHAIYYAAVDALGEDNVLSRDKSAIGMELDVYIPSLSTAFEPGSWYYHKSRVEVDNKKREKCEDTGIKLYIIYTAYKGETPAPDGCIVTPYVLGSFEWSKTREVVVNLLTDAGVDVSNVNWKRVYMRAVVHSGRRTTKQFIEEMGEINPDIEVLGEYTAARSRVNVRCKKCGHEWNPSASSLLSGHGCPKCKGKEAGDRTRKTQEQFVGEIDALGANVDVLDEYRGYDHHVSVRCRDCGYEWRPMAGYLLKGHKCPKCSNSLRKTNETFLKEMSETHPDIEILSKYVNTKTPVEARCLVCGYEWSTAAQNLIKGSGCPKCGRKKCDEARRKSHDKFVIQLGKRNPLVEAVGEYKYAREKMEFRCKECGHQWFATPDNILRGRGCPKCRYENRKKK